MVEQPRRQPLSTVSTPTLGSTFRPNCGAKPKSQKLVGRACLGSLSSSFYSTDSDLISPQSLQSQLDINCADYLATSIVVCLGRQKRRTLRHCLSARLDDRDQQETVFAYICRSIGMVLLIRLGPVLHDSSGPNFQEIPGSLASIRFSIFSTLALRSHLQWSACLPAT